MRQPEPGATGRKTISVEEAGRRLGISRNSAYEAAKRGEIPTIRIGRLVLVPELPFERMIDPEAAWDEGSDPIIAIAPACVPLVVRAILREAGWADEDFGAALPQRGEQP